VAAAAVLVASEADEEAVREALLEVGASAAAAMMDAALPTL
jgi:hypothetical protein